MPPHPKISLECLTKISETFTSLDCNLESIVFHFDLDDKLLEILCDNLLINQSISKVDIGRCYISDIGKEYMDMLMFFEGIKTFNYYVPH
jgi:hypothetical protein